MVVPQKTCHVSLMNHPRDRNGVSKVAYHVSPACYSLTSNVTALPVDNATAAMAADLHTITQIIHIWSDRLQLISVYASFFTSIDSVLFSLASSRDKHTPTSKLMLASLVGALIFHAATAILAYIASFVVIRYKLNSAQLTTSTSESPITSVYAKYASSRSISDEKPQPPSALESGHSTSRDKAHLTHTPHAFISLSTTPFLARGALSFSTLTSVMTSLLDEPPLLKIDLGRASFFSRRTLMPCLDIPVYGGDPRADEEKNAKALVRLLNRCHNVGVTFALSGFLLLVTGIVAYLWAVLEHSVAIFGSAIVAVCIVLGIAALL
ncbi:hypothetical protein BJV77DRAFT_251797 [Russula vinacea]|nr:hypothetical protein BJV77DRAFT_251797 [Russula vinacea]